MNAERLLYLADGLETVPSKRFKMHSWFVGKFCGKPKEPTHHSCKSSACAMGWGTTLPKFKKLGLKNIEGMPRIKNDRDCQLSGFQAAEYIFEISALESRYLFEATFANQDRYRETPKQVAKRIRKFVKLRDLYIGRLYELDKAEYKW